MAFRKKAEFILKQQPDILIVPECEHPERLKFGAGVRTPTDVIWYGTNLNKGLGVFSYCDYKFQLLDLHNPSLRTILPIKVYNDHFDFTLFAIWANNPEDKDGQYITQVWKAIHYYEDILGYKNVILAGDFNSNTIWDKQNAAGSHSVVVKMLAERNIFSAYHTFYKQEQGKELHPTLYLYRHLNRPYHIDYCFASSDFMEKLQDVEVGVYDDWAKYSDHKPVSVSFTL